MTVFVQFLLLGLGVGAAYTLAAQGVVLIAKGSGVLNFAQGAFAVIGAYAYVAILDRGLPEAVAVAGGLLAAGLAALACQLLVMQRLRSASPVTRLVATLGILLTVRQAFVLIEGDSLRLVTGFLPNHVWEPFDNVRVGADRIWLLGIACALTAALWLAYRFTRFGLATAAVAESERNAAAVGISAGLVAAVNWTAGGMLGGLAGILLVPIIGLSVSNLALLALPGIAAALLGRFTSFPLTLLGGLVVGVTESELARYVSTQGIATAAPFLLIIVIIATWPERGLARMRLAERLPALGDGRVAWRALAPALVLLTALLLITDAGWARAFTTTFTLGLVALSLVVVTGYTGQLSLAQFALGGVGALLAARVSQDWGLPFPACVAIGVLGAIPVGALIALPALRSRGTNLAVMTLGFAVVIEEVILTNGDITGGLSGTQVDVPALGPLSLDPVAHPQRYAIMCLLALTLTGLIVANLRRSQSGRRMVAVRHNERAAAALGVSVVRAKLFAFAIASGVAALGGILAGFVNPSVTYGGFGILDSINAVVMAVIGGAGFVLGPIFGTIPAGTGISAKLTDVLLPQATDWLPLFGGVTLIATVLGAPDGVVMQMNRDARRLGARLRPADRSYPVEVPGGEVRRPDAKALEVRGVSVSFGGVHALTDVSLSLRPGEVVGLVGPNGAGKTTLIDVISGHTRRYQGQILLGGEPVDRLAAWRRARAGIGRSFQSLELFDEMTVFDNIAAAHEGVHEGLRARDLAWPTQRPLTGAAALAVSGLGLEQDLARKPSELSHGRRRLVAIARTIAADPCVVLLDEPAAGLDVVETAELGRLVRRLAEEWGMGVVLVEHDIELVMSICDRVVALAAGRAIASGAPDAVRHDQAVVAAFLGSWEERQGAVA